jgi:hypothetical protein
MAFFDHHGKGKWAGAADSAENRARDHHPWCEIHAAASAFGLSAGYTRGDVDSAFRRLARKAHPDVGGTHEAFKILIAQRDLLLSEAGPTITPRPDG